MKKPVKITRKSPSRIKINEKKGDRRGYRKVATERYFTVKVDFRSYIQYFCELSESATSKIFSNLKILSTHYAAVFELTQSKIKYRSYYRR